GSFKAQIDWTVTPRYRIRGGFNRAFRAPNLGELYQGRTTAFAFGGANYGDHCSQNLSAPSPYGATPGGGASAEQIAQTLKICRALMGVSGAAEYYDNRALAEQPTAGSLGIPANFGNPDVKEEKADTFTLGVVMNMATNTTLTVDYYTIEIKNMIALAPGDATYERCLSLEFNPTGDPNAPACQRITRDPTNGSASVVDRSYTNQGRALVAGVDLQLNWSKMFGGGGFSINSVANYNLHSITQAEADIDEIDYAGFNGCALGLQCQRYRYRIFTTFGYFHGAWNFSLRHQFWPELDANSCRTAPDSVSCTYGSLPSYNLFALTAGYRLGDKYRFSLGIENLFDTDPPCTGADPTDTPFPTECTHNGGATYDPLGRRFFLGMQMNF
ncbi:MAG TPA: TonB-dependent receptor, partial [Gammaproteobacteria bacterium]|nr:TonB-dependent receptor [Gammaproteobacteria bacterium]